jgi:glutaredoxin 3
MLKIKSSVREIVVAATKLEVAHGSRRRHFMDRFNNASRFMPPVTIYTTSSCPYCIAAKRLLTKKGVDFSEIDVGADPAKRSEMTRLAHGSYTVPQIFIGSHHVGGCDDLYALESAGKLDALLAG